MSSWLPFEAGGASSSPHIAGSRLIVLAQREDLRYAFSQVLPPNCRRGLVVYGLLVAIHLGEFWPFSIYPMFSQTGNPWTGAAERIDVLGRQGRTCTARIANWAHVAACVHDVLAKET